MVRQRVRARVSEGAQYFVVMGAAVRPDGGPSGALRRRVEIALRLGQRSGRSFYLATGGEGKFGPAESQVMAALFQAAGVPANEILTDSESHDTLSSVVHCSNILRNRQCVDRVVVCTDRYHVARCRWLFWLSGIRTFKQPMPSGRRANGTLRWTYYYLRELFAIPWDTFLLLGHRVQRQTRPV
jgi:vancomycin permeability regulator SanA